MRPELPAGICAGNRTKQTEVGMKRLHVHVGVADLASSIRFYSTLFAAEPSVVKPDYAKWMLDDPRVNFAISSRATVGLDHLGIQAESGDELDELRTRMRAADRPVLDQGEASCCYAKSAKAWTDDPAGIAWEAFHTIGAITTYGEDSATGPQLRNSLPASVASCCTPSEEQQRVEPASACCNPAE
jgi:catechol 2,3-dioxygenase-like lactoylglutathione lyase family enzyme